MEIRTEALSWRGFRFTRNLHFMKYHFDLLRASRRNVLGLTQQLSLEQLNHVPAPFRNNLAWNLGHLVVTQQLLCYRLAGQPGYIDDEMIAKYRKGTAPLGPIDATELEQIRQLLVDLVDRTEQDYAAGVLSSYKPYATSYGLDLNSVEDAIHFNNLHESMHLGTCLSLRKMVLNTIPS